MLAEPQYSLARVALIWAAAAGPMGLLAWVVVPWLQPHTDLHPAIVRWLVLTAGLAWQAALCLWILRAETGTFSPRVLARRLWLQAPSSAGTSGGRLWLWMLPVIVGTGVVQLLPVRLYHPPPNTDLAQLSEIAPNFRGAWWLVGLAVTSSLFNYFIGEELLFRGILLPRMRGAFGPFDWLANAVLFGLYHVHAPWVMADAAVAGAVWAWASRRFGSAWFGVIGHGAEGVFAIGLVTMVVLGRI